MKKLIVIQISLLLIFSFAFGGLFIFTDVYNDIKSSIVERTCYSCLKLDKVSTLDFTFETVGNKDHPDFVLDNLTKGPVFIAYGSNSCNACNITDAVLMDIFNVEFEFNEFVIKGVNFDESIITFFHINVDEHCGEYRYSFDVYDKSNQNAVPMFVVITWGNNSGVVEPCYATAYGTLGSSDNERSDFILEMIHLGLVKFSSYSS